jgi:hypothetical protein
MSGHDHTSTQRSREGSQTRTSRRTGRPSFPAKPRSVEVMAGGRPLAARQDRTVVFGTSLEPSGGLTSRALVTRWPGN